MNVLATVPNIHQLIEDRELVTLDSVLTDVPTHAVSELLDDLPLNEATVIFRLLGKDRAAEVFDSLDSSTQTAMIEALGDEELEHVFESLDPEEQAWLLDEVPSKVAKRIQRQLSPAQLARANKLLGYPEGSIARRMSPESVTALPHESVDQVLSRVRRSSADQDRLAVIPVIAADRKFQGTVTLLELQRAAAESSEALIESVLAHEMRPAHTLDSDEIVARDVLDDGLLIMPIVDNEDRLVGVFPIADAARIDREAVAEDVARQGGAEPLRRPYLLSSVVNVAKSRIVWLMVLAVSAVLTVQVLEMFEATLAEVVALALFVPLLTGIGGNTGSQAATTVTRAIGLGDVDVKDVLKVGFKELRTGMVLGLVLAVLAFSIATPFYGSDIGLVIGLTLMVNCPIAATVGGVIPLVARACKVDPAVFSTPFISTFCDATGLLIYFTVARTILGL